MATVLKPPVPSASADGEKPRAAPSGLTGLTGFNLDDLAEEGRKRLEAYQRQIEQLRAGAREEAAEIRAAAERRGYEEGTRRAAADFERQVQTRAEQLAKDQLARLTEATAAVRDAYQGWMTEYAEALTEIAISAAERIVGKELDQDRGLMVRWAEEAVRSTRSAGRLTLAVHPETLAELGQSLDEMLAAPELPETAHVEPDESLRRDEIAVRQDGGEVRTGLKNQLHALRESLT